MQYLLALTMTLFLAVSPNQIAAAETIENHGSRNVLGVVVCSQLENFNVISGFKPLFLSCKEYLSMWEDPNFWPGVAQSNYLSVGDNQLGDSAFLRRALICLQHSFSTLSDISMSSETFQKEVYMGSLSQGLEINRQRYGIHFKLNPPLVFIVDNFTHIQKIMREINKHYNEIVLFSEDVKVPVWYGRLSLLGSGFSNEVLEQYTADLDYATELQYDEPECKLLDYFRDLSKASVLSKNNLPISLFYLAYLCVEIDIYRSAVLGSWVFSDMVPPVFEEPEQFDTPEKIVTDFHKELIEFLEDQLPEKSILRFIEEHNKNFLLKNSY